MLLHKYINIDCDRIGCPQFNGCCHIKTDMVMRCTDNVYHYLFIGMGGGEEEMKTRHPFVGKSGIRIRRIMEEVVMKKINNEFNYAFSNTVRCRPPNNREPAEDELQRCLPYLYRDIDYLEPLTIITLGLSAFQSFFPKEIRPMGEIHGIEYKWINPLSGKMYSIFPTYHPSALIRKNGAFNPEKLNYLDEVVVKDIMECWMPF